MQRIGFYLILEEFNNVKLSKFQIRLAIASFGFLAYAELDFKKSDYFYGLSPTWKAVAGLTLLVVYVTHPMLIANFLQNKNTK